MYACLEGPPSSSIIQTYTSTQANPLLPKKKKEKKKKEEINQ